MTESRSNSSNGAWVEWSLRHRLGLSAAAHGALFVVAWVLAFGLARNRAGRRYYATSALLRVAPASLPVPVHRLEGGATGPAVRRLEGGTTAELASRLHK